MGCLDYCFGSVAIDINLPASHLIGMHRGVPLGAIHLGHVAVAGALLITLCIGLAMCLWLESQLFSLFTLKKGNLGKNTS